MDNNKKEVLLKVDHLCQYFKLGNKELKAVDDVSFEVYKGEVFGLVGESGCGKTTTGRSIIKLYNITSGDIYFKGQRIGAGNRSYKMAIAQAKKEAKEKINALQADSKAVVANKAANDAKVAEIKVELEKKLKDENAKIASASFDQKHCDHVFSSHLIEEVNAKYLPLMENAKKEMDAAKEKCNATVSEENKKVLTEKTTAYKEVSQKYKDDLRIAKNSKLVTQIQMIFQDPIASLNPRMTVQEIVSEGLVIKGIKDKKYIQDRVYEILELVGLVKEHASRYPHEFSGGQRQRIGIARSVIMNPEMIIADEPVSALDVSIQAQVINLLNELRNKLGLTILFIAHDLSVVKYFSDRIGVMYFGKMVELASADELFAHPLHPYTKSLLSAIPLPDPVYEKKRTRIAYNAIAEHDYSVFKPSFREIAPNHFVYCNEVEEKKYKEEYAK